MDNEIESGFGMDRDGDRFSKKKGQSRGADGKFEAAGGMKDDDEFDMDFAAYGSDKPTKKREKPDKFMDMGGRKGNDLFEGQKKKGRGRPSGTGGHVANVFYDSQLPVSQDMMKSDSTDNLLGPALPHSGAIDGTDGGIYGGQHVGGLDGVLDAEVVSRQESEKELCNGCFSSSYIPTTGVSPAEDPNVMWVECGKCFKWYHAPCAGINTGTFDVNKEWYCCLQDKAN